MAHFALRFGPFRMMKWAETQCEMGRFVTCCVSVRLWSECGLRGICCQCVVDRFPWYVLNHAKMCAHTDYVAV